MQNKAAVINDFASYGRCSLAVAFPILSAMKVQCCAVPTAIFTNHTGYPSFSWTDYTAHMDDYIREWLKLGLSFNAIQTGFLGSCDQLAFVSRFLDAFRRPETIVAVDPVMGDYGRLYSTYSPELAERMRNLLAVADILTPNLTEACVLAGHPYDPMMPDANLTSIAREISEPNGAKVVITGIQRGGALLNFIWQPGRRPIFHAERKIGPDRSGTGDVFSSVILADAINGVPFADSVVKASSFVAAAVRRSVELDIPVRDGLAIEEVLSELISPPPRGEETAKSPT